MLAHHLADATDLEQWADRVEGRYDLPELIRRLVLATSSPRYIDFRAQEGTGYKGWDGHVEVDTGTAYVPKGISGWEMGAGTEPQSKANNDYKKRTKKPDPFDPTQTAFIFCTPRRWAGKDNWVSERQQEGKWAEVRAYDADNLATWLAQAPGVHVWFSLRIGKPIEHVQDLSSWWHSWATITLPSLSPALLMSGRGVARQQLIERLSAEPGAILVRAEGKQEALAFVAAAIESQPSDLRDQLGSRSLLIETRGTWRYFASQDKPLILIPDFLDTALVNQAIQNGHQVIVPVGAGHRSPVTLNVPRLSAVEAQDVLEREGLPSTEARHAAALARRSLAAYRRVRAGVSLDVPEWAQGETGPVLLPLVLAGEWNETVEGDHDALERLAECPYKEIKALLWQWRNSIDAPFRLIGSRWSVNAKEDAWRLLAQYAMQKDLHAFVKLILEVLPERDPKHGLSYDKQLLADVQGKRRRYSSALRDGLADSLAMLGALGSQVTTADGSDTSDFATWAVRDLMKTAMESPESWFDLAPHLSALAEAAPDTFLGAVERDLATENPTLLILFEPQPGLLTPNYEYPYLLWALEQLGWSPTHFPHVALILARLADAAPQTKIVNSPSESLMSFFRLWLPQCGATPELRLQTLDRIRASVPDIAWNLMVRLLPTGHDSASVLSGPGSRAVLWRDWPSEATKPTRLEYWESVEAVSDRLLEDVEVDSVRWLTLVEHLSHLHPSVLEKALQKLEVFPSRLEDTDLQSKLWAKLREFIAKHRAYSKANWAMPTMLLDRLDAILSNLIPNDPTKQYQWLFSHHPRLTTQYNSYRDQREELERRRVDAIQEIVDTGGADALFSFAEDVEAPSDVGSALFSTNIDPDATRRTIALLRQEGARKLIAQGFIWKAVREGGNNWIEKYLSTETLEKWGTEMRVSALLCFPFESATLDLVDFYDEQTQRQYWRSVNNIWTDDPDVFQRAIQSLIQHNRPRKALHELAVQSHEEQVTLDLQMVQQALYHSLTVSLEGDPTQIRSYDAERLLTYLRNHPDSDKEVLEKLEWYYLPLLGSDHGQLRLHERLGADPALFVEVVGLKYKHDKRTEPSSVDPEDTRRACHLLESWHSVPGFQEDGTLDEVYLKEWGQQAIALLEQAELKKGGLMAIGQMLRWGPKEQNGVWPSPAVCDIIQEISSDLVDESFQIAIYNSRGVTSRGPFDGGEQERQLAKHYEDYAEKLDAQWPRVAAILRQLAAEYHAEAKRHDQEAERAEDDIG